MQEFPLKQGLVLTEQNPWKQQSNVCTTDLADRAIDGAGKGEESELHRGFGSQKRKSTSQAKHICFGSIPAKITNFL